MGIFWIIDIFWKTVLTRTDTFSHVLALTDTYWHKLAHTDNYWHLLTPTDKYWHIMTSTYSDTCWHLLTLTDTYGHTLTHWLHIFLTFTKAELTFTKTVPGPDYDDDETTHLDAPLALGPGRIIMHIEWHSTYSSFSVSLHQKCCNATALWNISHQYYKV